MSQLLFDYTKNKIIELIEKIEKKNEEKFYFNDNQKQKKQLREVNKLIKELVEKLKKTNEKMPELKFKIGNKDYSLYCEDGEEDDLKKAVEIVNEKMDLFKNENDIPLARKFLMISILIANDLSQKNNKDFDQSMKNQLINYSQKLKKY